MSTPSNPGKKEKKKPIPVKTSLNSPYAVRWSPLTSENMHFILGVLKERLTESGLQKKEVSTDRRKWFLKKKCRSVVKNEPREAEPAPREAEPAPREAEPAPRGPGWTDVSLRKQLAIGINEVTRALEKNQLSLVLVCKSVKPTHMSSHLIALSGSRAVPACQVPRLSENISAVLGLRSVLALGFHRGSEHFSQAVAAIVPKLPPLPMDWVPNPAQGSSTLTADTEETQTGGRKRKIEDPSVPDEAPSATLQPLAVKKIVPNPAKTRKPKKIKTVAK